MVIDGKLMNLALEVKDFSKLEVHGPNEEKTTVLGVDNDWLSGEGKELLGILEGTEETMTSSIDEVTQCFAEASQAFRIVLNKLAGGTILWLRNVALPAFSDLSEKLRDLTGVLDPTLKEIMKKKELVNKGRVYGVSPKIMALCEHWKNRVAKKNWSRLRKEVERYEKKERYRGSQGLEQSYGSGSGNC